MGIVVEAAGIDHPLLKRILAAMAERRMTKVMGQAQRFGQVLVEAECTGHGPPDLRDFDRMGQAHSEMVAVGRNEHLGLVAQAAKCHRMDDPVAVALEGITWPSRASIFLDEGPAARS
jgi:hypothetical protein